MTEPLSQATPVTSSSPVQKSPINDLIELTTSDDLDELLRKAVGFVVRNFEAEAGSILFRSQTLFRARSGPFRPEALARIEQWETAIGKRLSSTTSWTIPKGTSVSVSTATLPNSRLTLANIPLVSNSVVVGSLSLVFSPGKSLTQEQQTLLMGLTGAIGHLASLSADVEAARQNLKQTEVFFQVGQALVTTFDIKKLLSDTMQMAVNVIDAGAASIMLVDRDNEELVFEVSHGARAQMLSQQRIPMNEGIAGWVAHHGQPAISNNARTDPRFSHRVDVRTGFLTQSIAAVPLKIKGRIIGVLEVLNKYADGGFTQEDIRLMEAVAAQAAIAIENARLYQKVRQERDYIIKAQENVRHELARNLHDGPVQLLSAISMSLDHLEKLNRLKPEAVHNEIIALRSLVHQAARDARALLFEMRPVILETQGLLPTFEQYVIQLRDAGELEVHFQTINREIAYDKQVAGTIFSIIQEALTNVKRHARARNVWLNLETRDGRFVVTVRDDGRGFDVSKGLDAPERAGHFGLLNMRERAELIEADFSIESRTEPPDKGTTVYLSVPLPGE
jgi:signal transduction histidine kinase